MAAAWLERGHGGGIVDPFWVLSLCLSMWSVISDPMMDAMASAVPFFVRWWLDCAVLVIFLDLCLGVCFNFGFFGDAGFLAEGFCFFVGFEKGNVCSDVVC